MAATLDVLLITLNSGDSAPHPSLFHLTTTSTTLALFLFLLLLILISTAKTIRNSIGGKDQNPGKIQSFPVIDDGKLAEQCKEKGTAPGPGNLSRSLLLDVLPSNSPKWDEKMRGKNDKFEDDPGGGSGSGREDKKRKKKRARRKRHALNQEEEVKEKEKEELICLYPFTKSSSAIQRKIMQQYDELLKSQGSKGLTLIQIGQFVNCLVDARNELQNKSQVIKRRFTIAKALLFKADRSSFDRLRQQIYKLELEQKRLEEDAFVYNCLQEQLKLSPAYRKMLEIGSCVEMKAEANSLVESTESEFSDISFEELLAKEKKDSFWLKNGKLRTCSS